MFLYGLFFISNIFDYISDYKKILQLRLLCIEFNNNILYFLKLDNKLPFFQPRSVSISGDHCWNCHQKRGLKYITLDVDKIVDKNFLPDIGEFVFFSFYPSWVKKNHYLYIKEVVDQQKYLK